jgi:dephospho-CoA kinase
MKVLGITGGVGMGKSTAAKLLSERGVQVVDTDILARSVVEPGEPALLEIARVFGPEMIASDGRLRREQLASRVFSNSDERRRLESILHPRIRERWLAQVQEWRVQGVAICAVIIPLLFETSAEKEFDAIICVACSSATQRERLLSRGWTTEQVEQRISAQWPTEKKIALSDFVVWTEGGLKEHAEQIERILEHF